jgi:hypothetical protein
MERLREALTALAAFFPRYAAAAAMAEKGESLETLRCRFAELREPLVPRAAEFAARKMSPPLMAQARSLENQLHDLALCEETLARLLVLLAAPPSEPMRDIGDTFFQSLEFLLVTMAETGEALGSEGVDLLLKLTEDRGELMTSLRERYFAAGTGLREDDKRYIFEVTGLFSRTVYLIHEWAESCRVWTANH